MTPDYIEAIRLRWKAHYGVVIFIVIFVPTSLIFSDNEPVSLALGFIALIGFLVLIATYAKALFHGIRHIATEVRSLFKK